MTLEEMEQACAAGGPPDVSRHEVEAAPLHLRRMFYPLGFPVEVRTNSEVVLELYEEMWGMFVSRWEAAVTRCDVFLVEGGADACPPAPACRLLGSLMVFSADADHFTVSDLATGHTRVVVTQAALRHRLYCSYFLLQAPLVHLATAHTTPVHGGCVSLGGVGVMLCGDSGAGKSTLSYACARKGWTYTSDDGTYLLHEDANGNGRGAVVVGNCHLVRFRPETAELFPEIGGRPLTPRAAGKPSVEIAAVDLKLAGVESVRVGAVVFLKRHASEEVTLKPYSKEVARCFLQGGLFAPTEMRRVQHAALERLLKVPVLELRYRDLEGAVRRLRALVEEIR